jgi:hypothetical protein
VLVYDAYRIPAAPPPPPPPPVKKPFWTRPKVGAAGLVLGLLIGGAGAGDTDSDGAPTTTAAPPPAQVVQQGLDEAEVEQRVDDAVAAATGDLQEELRTQQEQAQADLRTARQQARTSRSTAVRKAVRQALAQRPPRIVEVPVEVPAPSAPAPEPPASTDPRFDTCGAANDAGYGPYQAGLDPEYDWYDDRDGDGLVCET